MTLHWRFADAGVREAVERWLADPGTAEVLRDNVRRRIVRIGAGEDAIVGKHFRTHSGRHPARERLKAWLRRSPAEKEARALQVAHEAGAPVPAPVGLGTFPNGDPLLVLPALPGHDLIHSFEAKTSDPVTALDLTAHAIHALHACGFVHGDLHHGNVRVADGKAWLLDLQSARRSTDPSARMADAAALLYSLREHLSDDDVLRFGINALSSDVGNRTEGHERLVRAIARRADAHARSRTRRAMRPGRRFERFRIGHRSGLHLRSVPAPELAALVATHDAAETESSAAEILKAEGRVKITRVVHRDRSLVVKEHKTSVLRALADAVRGSAGARAWRNGHGLLARDIAAALPIAFLERRVFGIPTQSLVVLENVDGPDGVAACDRAGAIDAQCDLVVALHRRQVDHGDLKATNWIHRQSDGRAVLVDLEGVRFPRRLTIPERLRGLAEWNASLPDRVRASTRRAALGRYLAETGLDLPTNVALQQVVELSLERQHRWTGADCACAKDGRR